MVIKNVVRGLTGGRTIDPNASVHKRDSIYKQAWKYIVADTRSGMAKRKYGGRRLRGRRRLRTKFRMRRRITVVHKRVIDTDGQAIPASGTTAYKRLTDIAMGDNLYQRTGHKIRLQSYTLRGTCDWNARGPDQTGSSFRVVVYLGDRDAITETQPTYKSDIYGVRNFPFIKHVLFDRVYNRLQAADRSTRINIRVPLRGKLIRYFDASSTSELNHELNVLFMAGDNMQDKSSIVNKFEILRWTE